MNKIKINAFYASDDGRFLHREKNIFRRLYKVGDTFVRNGKVFLVEYVMVIDSEQIIKINWRD